MLTFYCPNCWLTLDEGVEICPRCNYRLEGFNQLAFEDKLLAALHHTIPERQIMAAQILGNLHSERALPEFLKIVTLEGCDYFFLRAVLTAAAKIDHPLRTTILELASHHESNLVRNLADELRTALATGRELRVWDRHTG